MPFLQTFLDYLIVMAYSQDKSKLFSAHVTSFPNERCFTVTFPSASALSIECPIRTLSALLLSRPYFSFSDLYAIFSDFSELSPIVMAYSRNSFPSSAKAAVEEVGAGLS